MNQKKCLAALVASSTIGKIRQLQLISYLSLLLNATLIGVLIFTLTFSFTKVIIAFVLLFLIWYSILKSLRGKWDKK